MPKFEIEKVALRSQNFQTKFSLHFLSDYLLDNCKILPIADGISFIRTVLIFYSLYDGAI